MEEDAIKRSLNLSLFDESDNKEQFVDEVAKILTFVSDVKEIAVSDDVLSGAKNVFRDDAVTVPEGEYREPFLIQAPDRFKSWLVSKKIL